MDIQSAIKIITNGGDLHENEMQDVMSVIMRGEATEAQLGGLLVGLHMKGECIAEITAAAKVMRQLFTPVHARSQQLVDTCGTGGDGANTFNISTTAAFVAAGAGAKIAKHGNRAVSSKCGSADILIAAGVNLELDPEQIATCIDTLGIGFIFAPAHHSAMRHVIGARRSLGIKTLFNILGPLTNPASAAYQLIGLFSADWLAPMAQILRNLGSRHALIVHADDGLDEISISGSTQVAELIDGHIKQYTITPADFGIQQHDLNALTVTGIDDSLAILQSVLNNEAGPHRDIVCLNAGAAIYLAGLTDDLKQGVEKAVAAIDSGTAKEKLAQLIALSNKYKKNGEQD